MTTVTHKVGTHLSWRLTSHDSPDSLYKIQELCLATRCFTKPSLFCAPAN